MNTNLYKEVVAAVSQKVAELSGSVKFGPAVIDSAIGRIYREVEKDGWPTEPEERGRYVVKSLARCAVR